MGQDDASGKFTLDNDKLKLDWDKKIGETPIFGKIETLLKSLSESMGGRYVPFPFWKGLGNKKLTVTHPLIRVNPVNGRKALYVGSHASHIVGMPEEEGRALLKELLDFATREEFTYLHHWTVGDLVTYDNRAALHRARPYAISEHPRVLHRTTVAGEGPTVP